MNIIKKIEKELLFKNNIKDITSISLDSDYKLENNHISGNFIITGDYKIHEVSINREKFNFKIPFSYELDSDINMESVKVEINNFEYDFRKDELLVNIEYEISGDRKEVLEFDDEESLEEFLNNREVEIIDTRIEEVNSNNDEVLDNKEEIKNKSIGIQSKYSNNNVNDELFNKEINETREVTDNVSKEEIINSIDKPKDNFVSYKIYKIKENDTLESIVLKYKTTLDDLKEYNDLNNIQINDKIIVPYYE